MHKQSKESLRFCREAQENRFDNWIAESLLRSVLLQVKGVSYRFSREQERLSRLQSLLKEQCASPPHRN
jgi:hypothetical protein